jgi:hypothetical protein
MTKEDILSIMPEGLVTGATLYIRLGGPREKEGWLESMKIRPPKDSRARSGWMAGAALIVFLNRRMLQKAGCNIGKEGSPPTKDVVYDDNMLKVARKETESMARHLGFFEQHLGEFVDCVMKNTDRVKVVCSKGHDYYKVDIPEGIAVEGLHRWCAAEWPETDDVITFGLDPSQYTEATDEEVRASLELYNPERIPKVFGEGDP